MSIQRVPVPVKLATPRPLALHIGISLPHTRKGTTRVPKVKTMIPTSCLRTVFLLFGLTWIRCSIADEARGVRRAVKRDAGGGPELSAGPRKRQVLTPQP